MRRAHIERSFVTSLKSERRAPDVRKPAFFSANALHCTFRHMAVLLFVFRGKHIT